MRKSPSALKVERTGTAPQGASRTAETADRRALPPAGGELELEELRNGLGIWPRELKGHWASSLPTEQDHLVPKEADKSIDRPAHHRLFSTHFYHLIYWLAEK